MKVNYIDSKTVQDVVVVFHKRLITKYLYSGLQLAAQLLSLNRNR